MKKGDICGIVVTYHPGSDFFVRLDSISRQMNSVVIVDNGSTPALVGTLRALDVDPAIHLILNSDNLGIARALNLGILHAAERGFRWMLLMDQDSQLHDDAVESLLDAFKSFPEKNSLAVIGSGYEELQKNPTEPNSPAALGKSWHEVEAVITSGSLLSLSAYAAIGPFREEFFIDHVDREYCLRARALGYRIIKTIKPLMSHSIGTPTQHSLLWMRKSTSNHSADRRYYFARNDTVMLREYGNYSTLGWMFKSLRRCFRTVKRIVLYEDCKGD